MSLLLADIDATCAALGYYDGLKYIAEPDALQSLKHLIWILRRDLDNHEYRRHLGYSKVLQTDLVYMLVEFIENEELSDVLIRLLIILTNPTILMYRDGPPKDNHGRKVYMELIDILQGYKSSFASEKIWGALYKKLQTALEVDWSLRSEDRSLMIERILVLIRNVLQVPANSEAVCRTDNDVSIHDRVIWALYQSDMLNLLQFIISSSNEQQFYMHGLEILNLIYREQQTAESLANATLQRSNNEKQLDEQELVAARKFEKRGQTIRPPTARHSRFGGTFVIRNMKSVSDRDIICHQPLERVVALDFDHEKQQQKSYFRNIREDKQSRRRSAFSVRLCLREFCIEVLRSAYNTLVRHVRRVLENKGNSSFSDDSYLLWAIYFFMEFNRINGMQMELIGESLSVQCFHWVLTRMQHHMEMIATDKKHARLWAKRLHLALLTFRELLLSLLELQKLRDDSAQALYDMLLNNICYVLEYRETVLHMLINYNEAYSTKAYLRDAIVSANIFLKLMEKFSKETVLVQEKKQKVRKRQPKLSSKTATTANDNKEKELNDKWTSISDKVSKCLKNAIELPEAQQPVPFDSTLEKSIDDQKEDCMIKIHKLLHEQQIAEGIALLRAAREVWPENDVFGAMNASLADEILVLREICIHNITTVNETASFEEIVEADNGDDDSDEEEDYANKYNIFEKTFKFDDFAKRFVNGKIVRACTLVLTEWQQIPTKSLKAAVSILHRIAYGFSCPAMLYQGKLFRIFQQVFHAPRASHHEELRRLGIFVIRKFVEFSPANSKIFAEILFYKSIKEANELESGYCDLYESGTRGIWTFEQEEELRLLFDENQRCPETDKDVIDWILENLIDKTRTRRGVLRKLKELGLKFKAPTKKSAAAASNKNQWKEEDDEELINLFNQYRLEENFFQKIMSKFADRRNKQQIIKRMLHLHIIADRSEIQSKNTPKSKYKKYKKKIDLSDEDKFFEKSVFDDSKVKKLKIIKVKAIEPINRNVVCTPVDIETVKSLITEVNTKKYQDAIEWVKECLNDAAEDTEDLSDSDGVPLLPLTAIQKAAMEDADFKKVLLAFGIQPPVAGMETYWRIPTYLTPGDLKLRITILEGGKILKHDVKEYEMENILSGDFDEDYESEEDYLDNLQHVKMIKKTYQNRKTYESSIEEENVLTEVQKAYKKENENVYQKSGNDTEINRKKKKLKLKKQKHFLSSDDECYDTEQKKVDDITIIPINIVNSDIDDTFDLKNTTDDTSCPQKTPNIAVTNKRQRSPNINMGHKVDDLYKIEGDSIKKKQRIMNSKDSNIDL